MVRRSALAVVCLLTVGIAIGGHAEEQSQRVDLNVSGTLEGTILYLRGEATVPDGAWISYAVYRPAEPARRATGVARVEGQRFDARSDIAGWPAGEIVVDVHFQMLVPGRTQPEAVIARYGPRGGRMTGPDVIEGGGSYRAAVASTTVIKR